MTEKKRIGPSGLRRRLTAIFIALGLTMSGAGMLTAAAADESGNDPGQAISGRARQVTVLIDTDRYPGTTMLVNSVTYVGIREYAMYMGAHSVSWNSDAKTATVISDNLNIKARYGSQYIEANGRYLWAGSGILIQKGTMYVPVRVIAKAFGSSVDWDGGSFSALVSRPSGTPAIASGDSFYDSDDVYWLSRIIHAEAVGEPLSGKIAVGSVVLNRDRSSQYPNNIYSVIFDRNYGVQFTPAANGTIYCEPSQESIIAAKLCLDGASISDRVLFFMNEAIAESNWIANNRPYVMTVGNHKFYA